MIFGSLFGKKKDTRKAAKEDWVRRSLAYGAEETLRKRREKKREGKGL